MVLELMKNVFGQGQLKAIEHYENRRAVRAKVVWGIMILIVLSQVIFFVWYRRRRQQAMNSRMSGAIDEAIVEYMRVN